MNDDRIHRYHAWMRVTFVALEHSDFRIRGSLRGVQVEIWQAICSDGVRNWVILRVALSDNSESSSTNLGYRSDCSIRGRCKKMSAHQRPLVFRTDHFYQIDSVGTIDPLQSSISDLDEPRFQQWTKILQALHVWPSWIQVLDRRGHNGAPSDLFSGIKCSSNSESE